MLTLSVATSSGAAATACWLLPHHSAGDAHGVAGSGGSSRGGAVQRRRDRGAGTRRNEPLREGPSGRAGVARRAHGCGGWRSFRRRLATPFRTVATVSDGPVFWRSVHDVWSLHTAWMSPLRSLAHRAATSRRAAAARPCRPRSRPANQSRSRLPTVRVRAQAVTPGSGGRGYPPRRERVAACGIEFAPPARHATDLRDDAVTNSDVSRATRCGRDDDAIPNRTATVHQGQLDSAAPSRTPRRARGSSVE